VTVIVEHFHEAPSQNRRVELVERKGMGHPDTICDALAEEVSRALSRYYLERFGRVLHHNVDKALLCGGSARPRFGGGEVTAPIEMILAGRATTVIRGVEVPAMEIATEASRAWLRTHIRHLDPDRHVRIECRFRPGSADLADVFDRGPDGGIPLSNDTSIGVGFAPLSPLEASVLDVERWINASETKRERPETGEDVKVMGVRRDGATELTVACAFVDSQLRDAAAYLDRKADLSHAIETRVRGRLAEQVTVAVNAADDPARDSFYLTTTGTSAEAGDDGEVGRGNRVNGLITPGRPMTMEAAAGKNPVSHVGKLYNLTAGIIARELVETLAGVSAAECLLVSRIGAPVNEPRVVSLRLGSADGEASREHEISAADIATACLGDMPSLARRLIAGELEVY
jgi:S-adenosylmethionine synthetase